MGVRSRVDTILYFATVVFEVMWVARSAYRRLSANVMSRSIS